MRWMLDCLGFSDDFQTEEGTEALLGIALNNGTVYQTHYKEKFYVNYWYDWMQVCAHVVCQEEKYSCINSDVHVPGSADTYWTCKIVTPLEGRINEDPLEKRVLVTNKEGAGAAVLNLVNADLLPSCDAGDEINVQVIGKAYTLKHYETEEDCDAEISVPFEPKWEKDPEKKASTLAIGTGSIMPIGFFMEHQVNINDPEDIKKERQADPDNECITIARGKVIRVNMLTSKLEDKILTHFVSIKIENNDYGVLNLIASPECMPLEERKK